MMCTFTEDTQHAIQATSEQIVWDIDPEYRTNPEDVAETVLDAHHLIIYGHNEAYEEVRELVGRFGWKAVVLEAAKFVSTF